MCGDTLEKKIQEGTFKGEADDPKKAAQELIWALSLMRKENIVHSNIKPSTFTLKICEMYSAFHD